MSAIGVITARAGSKGLPGKNMLPLGGKPLIEHTFETVNGCAGLQRTFLSTDIDEAIALARAKYPRIEVPFRRPAELCADAASQVAVAMHLLDYLQEHEGLEPSVLALFQPTSPFRRVEEVEAGVKLVAEGACSSLIGVTRVLHHPADYIYRQGRESEFRWVMRSPEWKRRQDFPPVYFNTGALYVCRADYLRRYRRFYDEESHLFVMAEESALDVDTPFDFALAAGWCALHRSS